MAHEQNHTKNGVRDILFACVLAAATPPSLRLYTPAGNFQFLDPNIRTVGGSLGGGMHVRTRIRTRTHRCTLAAKSTQTGAHVHTYARLRGGFLSLLLPLLPVAFHSVQLHCELLPIDGGRWKLQRLKGGTGARERRTGAPLPFPAATKNGGTASARTKPSGGRRGTGGCGTHTFWANLGSRNSTNPQPVGRMRAGHEGQSCYDGDVRAAGVRT